LKFELSRGEAAEFRFHNGSHTHIANLASSIQSTIDLRIPVTRTEFELWIQDDLQAIETCIESLLKIAGVPPSAVDRVFLTGGTSFVPAVRRIFASRFGEDRIRSGNEFTSVAHGLALRAAEGLNRPS
jgi:hypothetical chaperone protein